MLGCSTHTPLILNRSCAEWPNSPLQKKCDLGLRPTAPSYPSGRRSRQAGEPEPQRPAGARQLAKMFADASRCVALMAVQMCHTPTCMAMTNFWHSAAAQFSDVWYLDCEDEPSACEDLPLTEPLIHSSEPLILLWDKRSWLPYTGTRSLKALARTLAQLFGPSGDCKRELLPATASLCNKPTSKQDHVSLLPGQLHTWPSQALPTQIFLPAEFTMSSPKWPILLFFHGSPPDGGRFDGGDGSLRGLLRDNASFAARFPFIVLFPCSTCDTSGQPRPTPAGGPPATGGFGWTSQNFARIDVLLQSTACTHNGDEERVLLMGESYGGHGVWKYAAHNPYRVAALVPVASSFSPSPAIAEAVCCAEAPELCCPGVWIFHASNDVRAGVQGSDTWAHALRAQPHRPTDGLRYSRYDDVWPLEGEWAGHLGIGTLAYFNDELYGWLGAAARQGSSVGADVRQLTS